jgi:Anti-sigma-K factor rskA, C-terminal
MSKHVNDGRTVEPVLGAPEDAAELEAIERVLTWLALGPADRNVDVADDSYLEALAFLPYELPPAQPPAALRDALLARLKTASATSPEATPKRNRPLPFREPSPATASSVTAPRRGMLALAASLAICLIGLGYVYGQLSVKNQVIAQQEQRLAGLPHLQEELRLVRDELRLAQDRLTMVSTVAQQAYTLHPATPTSVSYGSNSAPSGRVYVCGAHQQWFLSLTGLTPPPAGEEYRFWFMTEKGPIAASTLDVEDGRAALRDLHMPLGTHGFSITLEPIGSDDKPHGQMILIGDHPVRL